MKKFFGASISSIGLIASYTLYDLHEWTSDNFWMPIVKNYIPPEAAHQLALNYLKVNLLRSQRIYTPALSTTFFGQPLDNPLGIAAGFDKHGEAIDGLKTIGFGFIEIGSITPEPQDGNPKPRLFRYLSPEVLINRYGMNSVGISSVLSNLSTFSSTLKESVIGINIGKNTKTPASNSKEDFITSIQSFQASNLPISYFTLNLSCPNTPNSLSLQNKNLLEDILTAIMNITDKPVFLKIPPALSESERREIATLTKKYGVHGLIISNTSSDKSILTNRMDIEEEEVEEGGISGEVLKEKSNELLRDMYELTEGKVVLIGVGGVSNGKDALEKIKNGASYVQLYTSMMFNGFLVVRRTLEELNDLVLKEGKSHYSELIGTNCRIKRDSG